MSGAKGERLQFSRWKVQKAESASVTSRTTTLLLLTNFTSMGLQSSVVFPAQPCTGASGVLSVC